MAIYTDIQLLGDGLNGGCYLLAIWLSDSKPVIFGRYNNSKAVQLPAGAYLYIGSARAKNGASSLGPRLMRHATRSNTAPAHTIRARLSDALSAAGLSANHPVQKRLRWHIDYLLDQPEADIRGVIALRSQEDHETMVAEILAGLSETSFPAKGLGASDHPGGTHLFYVQAGEDWWGSLPSACLNWVKRGDG